jgi:hypothetical protein
MGLIMRTQTVEAVNGIMPDIYLDEPTPENEKKFREACESIGCTCRETIYYTFPIKFKTGFILHITVHNPEELENVIQSLENHGLQVRRELENYHPAGETK